MTEWTVTAVARSEDSRRGTLHLLGAAVCFSLMSLLVRLAGKTLPSEMMVLARGLVTLVMSYLWLRRRGVPMWGKSRGLLVLRGLFGLGGLYCFYLALTRLPLVEATSIHYLNPILTTLLAGLILGEGVRGRSLIALALGVAGTLLITRPAWLLGAASGLDAVGLIAASSSAVFSAAAYVTVRHLTRSEEPMVIVFYFPLVAVPLSLPLVLPNFVWPQGIEWLILLGVGVTTQLGQVQLTRGLRHLPAGRATTLGYAQIPLVALWGYLFFADVPSAWSWAGALSIFAGAVLVALGNRQPTPASTAMATPLARQ